ncbi:MAG: DHA2 family efflux MFS transporter permease subunit [Rickettsiales bacterium]
MLEYLTFRRFLLVLTVQLTTLLHGMSITVIAVVLPQMKGTLSATQDQIAWTITFNLVATAIATPMTGWLAARLGWRNLLVGTVIGFTVSTALCGMADSLEALVFYRILQGIFGAPLQPLGQGMLLASFPKHLHAMVLMMWGIGGVFGPVLGPVFGGVMAEAINWRWAFFAMVPFGVIGAVTAWIALDEHQRGSYRSLDWFGIATLSIAIGAATLMLNRGQRLDWFDSPEIILETIVACLAFYLYLVHTFTAERPFFDRALFVDRNFVMGLFLSLLMGMLSYTPMVMFPPMMKELAGYPESVIGYLLTARGIGNWMSFLIVVPLTRRWPRLCLALGLFFQALSGFSMAQLDANINEFDVFWMNVMQGFGFGLGYTPMATLAFSTLHERLAVEGSALFNVMRHFGSVVFISFSILILVYGTEYSYSDLRQWVSPFNELFSLGGAAGGWTHDTLEGLAGLEKEARRQAAMIGYINSFYLFTITAALSIPFVLLFRTPGRAADAGD